MTEQQIQEEVLRYIKDQSYNYAVLIDGEWGSGKTYFVKNILRPLIEKQENESEKARKVKYVSLYGCKSIADVQENIAWTFAELARDKIKNKANFGDVGEKVSDSFFLSSKKIGNIILKKYLAENSLYEITSDWLNLGSYIFVFDDLERCDCPLNEVFGFLNELVEHENTKVIIVANEKEVVEHSKTQMLELQYSIALDNRIKWPKIDGESASINQNDKSDLIDIDEINRRKDILFSGEKNNNGYYKIREKLIGTTMKFEPNISKAILHIIDAVVEDNNMKEMLKEKTDSIIYQMRIYNHINLRSFQFFLSKVIFLINQVEEIDTLLDYQDVILSRIVDATLIYALKFKSNYQSREDSYWFMNKQEDSFESIKLYVEAGTYSFDDFKEDVLRLQNDLKTQLSNDDPYVLLSDSYRRNTEQWCKEKLDELLERLKKDKYPINFYVKLILEVQHLVDIGFNKCYLETMKAYMLDNIPKHDDCEVVKADLWYIDDNKFKERVMPIINEIVDCINEHSITVRKYSIAAILDSDDWLENLERYIKPESNQYVKDISLLSKANSEKWLNVIKHSSPKDLDHFRFILDELYPRNVIRKSFSEDVDTINQIIDGLSDYKSGDLIKDLNIKWINEEFEDIVKRYEST